VDSFGALVNSAATEGASFRLVPVSNVSGGTDSASGMVPRGVLLALMLHFPTLDYTPLLERVREITSGTETGSARRKEDQEGIGYIGCVDFVLIGNYSASEW